MIPQRKGDRPHTRAAEPRLSPCFSTRRRLNLKKGTLWIQDPRTLHRGTPNYSTQPRPELVICYSLPWFTGGPIEMLQEEFDKLSERGKKMLAAAGFSEHADAKNRFYRLSWPSSALPNKIFV